MGAINGTFDTTGSTIGSSDHRQFSNLKNFGRKYRNDHQADHFLIEKYSKFYNKF